MFRQLPLLILPWCLASMTGLSMIIAAGVCICISSVFHLYFVFCIGNCFYPSVPGELLEFPKSSCIPTTTLQTTPTTWRCLSWRRRWTLQILCLYFVIFIEMDLVSHDKSVFILILKVNLVSYGPACLPVQGADFTDTMAWVYGRRMHMTQDCIFGCIYISFSRLGGDNCEWTSGYKVARAGGKNQPEQARKPRSCASLKVCPLSGLVIDQCRV